MRKPAFAKVPRGRQVSRTYTLPAPVGGLNKRDSIASMSELDALVMDNAFPETNDVRVRRGYTEFATGFSSQVESLMPYNKPDGTQSLFAASGTDFFDVSSSGAIGAAVQSGLTNSRWQSVNFVNSSGTSYLCAFNGEDSPRYWDDSSWTTVTGVSSPAITGVTPSNIVSAAVHKRRMWLVLKNDLDPYYLPPDSVGGEAKALPLGGIASKGGYLQAIGTWTRDAGDGIDDYIAFITSEGQLIAYQGTDPSTSSSWALVGVWEIGEPIGRRCFAKFEGDLICLTIEGITSIGRVLTLGETTARVKLTDKINKLVSDDAAAYKGNFGWQMLHFPEADMLLLNVPVVENGTTKQYAMNTITGQWGGPFDVFANCWATSNSVPYFGSSNYVGDFWAADKDVDSNIDFDVQGAYSYLGSRGRLKKAKAIKPFILASGTFEINIAVNSDFSTETTPGAISFSPPNYGLWDSGVWDSAIWGGGLSPFADWQNAGAVGSSMSVRMKGEVGNIEFRYQAADIVFEYGGVIG